MRTTVTIPDKLFRKVKATAALRGKRIKDLVEEGLLLALEVPQLTQGGREKPKTVYDLIKEKNGIVDLGSDPQHLVGRCRHPKTLSLRWSKKAPRESLFHLEEHLPEIRSLRVHGELVELRALIKVTTAAAGEHLVWTYLWAGGERHPRIASGDWLTHRDGR